MLVLGSKCLFAMLSSGWVHLLCWTIIIEVTSCCLRCFGNLGLQVLFASLFIFPFLALWNTYMKVEIWLASWTLAFRFGIWLFAIFQLTLNSIYFYQKSASLFLLDMNKIGHQEWRSWRAEGAWFWYFWDCLSWKMEGNWCCHQAD